MLIWKVDYGYNSYSQSHKNVQIFIPHYDYRMSNAIFFLWLMSYNIHYDLINILPISQNKTLFY